MRGKAALLVGLGAGYVLGTRDGRERYEQIKAQVERVRKDPRVQAKAEQAQEMARDAASSAADQVTSRTPGESTSRGSDEDAVVTPSPEMPPAPEPVDSSGGSSHA